MNNEALLSVFLARKPVAYVKAAFDSETSIYSFIPKETGGLRGIVVRKRKPTFQAIMSDDSEFEVSDLDELNFCFVQTLSLSNSLMN